MVLGEKEIAFKFESIHYISQLIDGKFPSYEKVIPQNSSYELELDRNDFMSALRRASVLTDPKLNRVKISLASNLMTISANTSVRRI